MGGWGETRGRGAGFILERGSRIAFKVSVDRSASVNLRCGEKVFGEGVGGETSIGTSTQGSRSGIGFQANPAFQRRQQTSYSPFNLAALTSVVMQTRSDCWNFCAITQRATLIWVCILLPRVVLDTSSPTKIIPGWWAFVFVSLVD